MKDLVVVVADRDTEQAISALLRRNQALQIRAVDFDIFVHPERDPGVLQQGVALLNEINALQKYRYALLLFDREGCGTGGSHPFRAGTEVQQQLT